MQTAIENRNYNYSIFEHFQTEEERIMDLFIQGGEYTALEVSRILNMDKVNTRRALHYLANGRFDKDGERIAEAKLKEDGTRIDLVSKKPNTIYKIIK